MKQLDFILDHLEQWLCVFLFTAMTLAVIFQIIFRSTGISLQWTEELSRYLFVWLIYIGSIKAVRECKHLKVDILSLVVKERGSYVFRIVNSLSAILFWAITSYFVFQVVARYLVTPQLSASLKINMAYMYAAPLVCGALSMVRYVQDIIRATQEYADAQRGAEKGADA